jgi:TPR repeat protein
MTRKIRKLSYVVCVVLMLLWGCTRKDSAAQANPTPDTASEKTSYLEQIDRLLGARGRNSYALIKKQGTSSASTNDYANSPMGFLMNSGQMGHPSDFDDHDAVSCILGACENLARNAVYQGNNAVLDMQQQIQQRMMEMYSGRSVKPQSPWAGFEKAALLDARWSRLWPHVVMDVLCERLRSLASADQSIIQWGDDTLISPKDRYYPIRERKNEDQGIVIDRSQSPADSNPYAFEIGLAMRKHQLEQLQEKRQQHTHFFMTGEWVERLADICSRDKTLWPQWRSSVESVADYFAHQGYPSSALMIKKTIYQQDGLDSKQRCSQGITWLQEMAKDSVTHPEQAHRLLVAVGYWGEIYTEFSDQTRSGLQGIIQDVLPATGMCTSAIVATHLGIDVGVLVPSFPPLVKPGIENETAHQWYTEAQATNDKTQKEVLFKQAVHQGHSPAMEELALLYHQRGQEKSAFQWLTRAAQTGLPSAITNLGMYYRNGIGCSRDLDRALHLYEQAANLGDGAALYNFVILYQSEWCPDSFPLLLRFCWLAGQQGCAEAFFHLAKLYHEGHPCLSPSIPQAMTYWAKAAQLGFAPAHFNLYQCYYGGESTETNAPQALNHLHAAAEAGHAEAMFRLYQHYDQGRDLQRNQTTAKIWLQRAAQYGHKEAQRLVRTVPKKQETRLPFSLSRSSYPQTQEPVLRNPSYRNAPSYNQSYQDAAHQRATQEAQRQMRKFRQKLNRGW